MLRAPANKSVFNLGEIVEVIQAGFGFRISDLGFRIWDFGFGISDFGFRISDFGFAIGQLLVVGCHWFSSQWFIGSVVSGSVVQ
jgi:hypothetical protein